MAAVEAHALHEIATEAPAAAAKVDVDFAKWVLVKPSPAKKEGVLQKGPKKQVKINFENAFKLQSAIGDDGETLALKYEHWRLRDKPELQKKIVHTAKVDDAAGYDILSFELDGSPRYVEVKSTTGPLSAPFFMSAGERRAAETYANAYVVLRIGSVRSDPVCCEIRHPLDDGLDFTPSTFIVNFKAAQDGSSKKN